MSLSVNIYQRNHRNGVLNYGYLQILLQNMCMILRFIVGKMREVMKDSHRPLEPQMQHIEWLYGCCRDWSTKGIA